MAAINIRRDVKDSFYRYKMPRLISKIEGKGNGIKTVIPNMSDIAKSLNRPPTYSTKYFGCELGAQVQCDEAKDRFVVNGAHDSSKLQSLLDGFIQRFVLCQECSNPETDLRVTKDGDIFRDCKACGQRTICDMRHKLTTFIVKNPPAGNKGNKKESKKNKDKRGKTLTPADSIDSLDRSQENGSGDSDDEITKRIEREAANLPPEDQIKSNLDDWSEDTSAAAVAARQKEMEELAKQLEAKFSTNDGDNDKENGSDPIELFAAFVSENMKASDDEIISKATSLGIANDKAVAVLVQVLFTDAILSQLPKRRILIAKLAKSPKAQKALLGGIERLVGVQHTALLPKVPMILKMLYDSDLLDEEVALEWGKKASKKYVDKETNKDIRKRAEPFLNWLENAEEESEDDE